VNRRKWRLSRTTASEVRMFSCRRANLANGRIWNLIVLLPPGKPLNQRLSIAGGTVQVKDELKTEFDIRTNSKIVAGNK